MAAHLKFFRVPVRGKESSVGQWRAHQPVPSHDPPYLRQSTTPSPPLSAAAAVTGVVKAKPFLRYGLGPVPAARRQVRPLPRRPVLRRRRRARPAAGQGGRRWQPQLCIHRRRALRLLRSQAVAEFYGNVELCRLTEQVVFSDPFKISQYNIWTYPYLDQDAEAVGEDDTLKIELN